MNEPRYRITNRGTGTGILGVVVAVCRRQEELQVVESGSVYLQIYHMAGTKNILKSNFQIKSIFVVFFLPPRLLPLYRCLNLT